MTKEQRTKSLKDQSTANIYKAPPQNIELEKVVLGICMMEAEAFEVASEIIPTEEVFYLERHKEIFKAMRTLFISKRGIDILTVSEVLKETGLLEAAGGYHYLTLITNDIVGSAHLQEHCLLVLQKFINRKIISTSQAAISRAYDESDCFENSDELIRELEQVTQKSIGSDMISMDEGVFTLVESLERRRLQEESLTGVTSGYTMLDHCTHGWQNKDLIIIAARPSVGKTALALNFAANAAKHPTRPVPVGFFSLEMGKEKIIERLVSMLTEVDAEQIARARFNDDQFERLKSELSTTSALPIYIDDTAAINSMELRAKARRMKRLYNVGMIIVDYLQLMSDVQDGEKRNREQQIARISRELKRLAKDLGIPIIALSQLSREVEKRGGEKMPVLSDLRESGAIEQDADVVMFLYRPEYYDVTQNEMGESTRGETHIRISKHRNGTLETIKLRSRLNIQKFENFGELSADFVKEHPRPGGYKMWQPGSNGD